MEKAFFTIGTIYLGMKLAGAVIRGADDFYHEVVIPKIKKQEVKPSRKMRQPIGFAINN